MRERQTLGAAARHRSHAAGHALSRSALPFDRSEQRHESDVDHSAPAGFAASHVVQADSIASMNRRYTYRSDSLWAPVARYLATLPTEYHEDEAFDRLPPRASRAGGHARPDRRRPFATCSRRSSAESCRSSSLNIARSAVSGVDSQWHVALRWRIAPFFGTPVFDWRAPRSGSSSPSRWHDESTSRDRSVSLRGALVPRSRCPGARVAQSDRAADTSHKPTPNRRPPIRKIATASALSTEDLGAINSVVELRDGRVLVNDGTRRRLLLMDTTLTKVEVVLDSLAEVANTYGTRPGNADSVSRRLDRCSSIRPRTRCSFSIRRRKSRACVRCGACRRPVPVYAPNGNMRLARDRREGPHRLSHLGAAGAAEGRAAAGRPVLPAPPDSAFIVAIDLDTRKLDTLGVDSRFRRVEYQIRQSAEGFFSITATINPLPTTDEWAVLPDGDIAFVRGRDYRVEYLHPDGTWTSSAKAAVRVAAAHRRRQAEARRFGEGREPSLADDRVTSRR